MKSEAEKVIQRDIELALGAEPDLLLMRNTVGFEKKYNAEGEQRAFHYGLGKGSPDLVGMLNGRWFALEVKAHDGVVSKDQRDCHDIWRRFGAVVAVVRSVQDAKRALAEARRAQRTSTAPPSKVGRR